MTIDEAKRLLKQDIDDTGSVDIMDLFKAEALGIEALKRLQSYRRHQLAYGVALLPGETEY